MTRLFLFALLLLVSPWLRAADEDLLEPEKAFRFSAHMVKPDLIEGQFHVVKGYYLYRGKIKLSAQGAKLGKPDLPAGKTKKDEIYGKVEVYAKDFRVRIPVSGVRKPFTLKAVYQGCAEVGVCYPPQTTTLKLQPLAPDKKAAKAEAKPKPEAKPEAVPTPVAAARLAPLSPPKAAASGDAGAGQTQSQIGRASCRERVS
jgi:thiol:disulfide interchange protein DsbD